MSNIYFYKLTVDNGGAPCIRNGLLSLAICKPLLRRTAKRGDLIFGFAANSLHRDNRLLYVARITDEARGGQYFVERRFANRADCVYRLRNGRFSWRHGAQHHGQRDIPRDLGRHPDYPRANVLLSKDFRYFGANGRADFKDHFPWIEKAVERLGRGHRVQHDKRLREEFNRLKEWIWRKTRRKVNGSPTSSPSRSACHRSRSCGVVGDLEGT